MINETMYAHERPVIPHAGWRAGIVISELQTPSVEGCFVCRDRGHAVFDVRSRENACIYSTTVAVRTYAKVTSP